MYNKELKTEFISWYSDSAATRNMCRVVFEKCSPFEEKFGGDICTMPEKVLTPILESLSGARGKSFIPRIVMLREYCSWCVTTGVQGSCRDILNVRISGLNKIAETMVSGPTHLQKCLNDICDPETDNTIDCIYRCYYWLSFAGMREDDILRVCGKDIDFENMEAHFEGMDYPIYREAINAFRNAVFLREFVYTNPRYDNIMRNRVDGDILMRGIRGTVTKDSMRVELSRRSRRALDAGVTDKRISHYKIWLSGLFYRMYENERAGYPVTFDGAAEAFMEGRIYKLDSGRNTPEAKKRQIIKEFYDDYERWKLVFQ